MHEFNYSMPSLPQLPAREYYEVLEALADVQLADVREAKTYQEALESLREEYLRERHAIIGEDNLSKYQQFRERRRRTMHSVVTHCPPTPEGQAEFEARRREWVEKSEAFIETLGVDHRRLESLQKSFQGKMHSQFLSSLGSGKTVSTAAEASVATDLDDEWVPPYDPRGSFCPRLIESSVGAPEIHIVQEDDIGLIQASQLCSLDDCGEADYQSALVRLGHRVSYTGDRDGLLMVEIVLMPTRRLLYMYSVHDEPGWSGVDITISFRLYARRVFPRPVSERVYTSLFLPVRHHEEGGLRRGGDIEHLLVPWSKFMITLPVYLPVRRDEYQCIDVGIESYVGVWGDDCTVSALLSYAFMVPSFSISVFVFT